MRTHFSGRFSPGLSSYELYYKTSLPREGKMASPGVVIASTALSPTTVSRRRFTIAEYYAMAKAGILHADDRVELIEGEVVQMSPINALHAGHVKRVNQLFTSRLGKRVTLSVQDPVHLGDDSEPQPDIALLKPRADFYEQSHPTPDDVLLIVEISDTTVEYDREVKAPLYARHRIQELWLVNLPEGQLEVYRDPGPKGYKTRLLLSSGDGVTPLAFADVTLRVDEILG